MVVGYNRSGGDGMIKTVKSLLFRDHGTATIYECRQCGTDVDSPTTDCPACGNDDIVRFHLQR